MHNSNCTKLEARQVKYQLPLRLRLPYVRSVKMTHSDLCRCHQELDKSGMEIENMFVHKLIARYITHLYKSMHQHINIIIMYIYICMYSTGR